MFSQVRVMEDNYLTERIFIITNYISFLSRPCIVLGGLVQDRIIFLSVFSLDNDPSLVFLEYSDWCTGEYITRIITMEQSSVETMSILIVYIDIIHRGEAISISKPFPISWLKCRISCDDICDIAIDITLDHFVAQICLDNWIL